MTTKGLLLLTVLCYIDLSYERPQHRESSKGFWNNARPGELLRSLDTITSTAQYFTQPQEVKQEINEPENKHLLRKSAEETGEILKENEENISQNSRANRVQLQRRIGEGSDESLEEKSPYDYDKAYEEFVKKYFDDSLTDALSASESSENSDNEQHDAEAYSGEEEQESSEALEPVIEASKKSSKTEKCKKVIRGQQHCLICKNLRNGENSESCSYNKETKPQSYGFEKQKNFRKYRATPKSSENKDSVEHNSSDKATKADNKSNNNSSSCTMNKIKNKVCYQCETSKGKKTTKCYTEDTPPLERNARDNRENLRKSQQRIYKRTLSYTYENTPHTLGVKNTTHVLDKPVIQKHFLFKEFNENER